MNLVYVNADNGIALDGPKGGAVHIVEMLHALDELGAQLQIVCGRVARIPRPIQGIRVEQVGPVASGPTASDRSSKEQGYQRTSQAIFERLIQLYSQRPFDAIYERYSLWSDAGIRAAQRLNVPCIYEINAPLVNEQMTHRELRDIAGARAIEQTVLKHADHIFAVSDQLRDMLCQKGAPGTKVSVLGNGVNLARFDANYVAHWRGEVAAPFTMGFSGSLKNWHGVRELMQAFQLVRQTIPDARLLIVGDGPKRQWLEGFAEGAGLHEALEVTGWVDHVELPALLSRMDVATAPYPDDPAHYFSPLKVFEYLAMGRPIVASRIGQIAQYLEHGDNAWLVEPGSAPALAAGIVQIWSDPERATRLGEQAKRQAGQHTWLRNARTVLDTVRRLCARELPV